MLVDVSGELKEGHPALTAHAVAGCSELQVQVNGCRRSGFATTNSTTQLVASKMLTISTFNIFRLKKRTLQQARAITEHVLRDGVDVPNAGSAHLEASCILVG